MSRIYYAAIGPDGNVIGVEPTAEEATEIAQELTPPGTRISVQHLDPKPTHAPNASSEDQPIFALRNTTLPEITPGAITMDLHDAYEALRPFFQGLVKRGEETHRYDTVDGLVKAWIGQNYKTKKKELPRDHPHQRMPSAQVQGLTLVPADHAYLASHNEGPYARLWQDEDGEELARFTQERLVMLRRWKDEAPSTLPKKFTFCHGSSPDCRDSCLVYTGQNASERYNTYRKVAQTMALLREPKAFMRVLIESMERWLSSPTIRTREADPFFRLNVLSDVPWELVAPWFFDHFSSEVFQQNPRKRPRYGGEALRMPKFYDYTKVPGRYTTDNYDLTFSISGEDQNLAFAMDEINQRGRRIAVVFIGHKRQGDSWRPMKVKGKVAIKELPLPRTFWGLPVVDGDPSDVRPYDPEPSCVGLRWKTPSGKRAGATLDLQKSAFVTPVYVITEEQSARFARELGMGGSIPSWRGGALGRTNPTDREEQWLICAVTPRYQPITPPMSQNV